MLKDASKRSLGPWVAENIEPGAIVHTDGWRSEERRLILPRAPRALSNAKTWLQGTHRRASEKHL